MVRQYWADILHCPPMSVFDFAIIGKGLVGSATARYLSRGEGSVVVIGPDEPPNPGLHRGVFSSHYDQGRITRLIGRDSVYSKLAELAIEQYANIEDSSGVRFHFPVGMLIAQAPHVDDGHMKDPLATARALGRRFTLYEIGDRTWKSSFPFFDFPEGYSVIHEPAPAGYINPRDMIRAQLTCADRDGASIVRETAIRIRRRRAVHVIETDAGHRYDAYKVVIAAGAFTNGYDLLQRKLALAPETESILLARVPEKDGERLASSPTVIYLVDDTEIWDVYMTPPIRYPDGHFYIKLGANSIHDTRPKNVDELGRWFRNGDSDANKEAFARSLRSLWPGLDFLSMETRRCVLTRTPNGYPFIDEVDDNVYVAAGGNGGSAKSSDALGRLAATVVRDEPWPDVVRRDLFAAQFADDDV